MKQSAAKTRRRGVSRGTLIGLAYRMLGSRAEAEDVVQDALERVERRAGAVDNRDAYLVRVVTNLSIDRLRAEKVRRSAYFGPWLPEPVVTAAPPDDITALSEDLGMALMLILERLSPRERAVFVLREAFGYTFAEIGELLDADAAACRQRYGRARRRLRGDPVSVNPARAERAVLEELMQAITNGQAERIVELLSADATLLSDGGGRVAAAIRPVTGRERIARVLIHVTARTLAEEAVRVKLASINGHWGFVQFGRGRAETCFTCQVENGRARRILVVRNPDKLEGVPTLE